MDGSFGERTERVDAGIPELSNNSLNVFTPLLILAHLLVIVGLWGNLILVGVSFSPGFCGFALASPRE